MSRSIRRSHARWWLIVGPGSIAILIVALIAKPAHPVESQPAPTTEPRK